MTVGLVVVSHSASLADGVRDLAAQMAPDVTIATAGGTDEGEIGTSFEKVGAALGEADSGDGVVVLYDLGSALLTTETALEFLDSEHTDRIVVVDAPLVEGAVAAAVSAQSGAALVAVAMAARSAADSWAAADDTGAAAAVGHPDDDEAERSAPASDPDEITSDEPAFIGGARATAVVADRIGIHARPAAVLTRELHQWPDADIRIGRPGENSVDAGSVLMLIGLGIRQGETVEITGTGDGATEAVQRIAELISTGLE